MLVGGGGIALIVVGIAYGLIVFGHVDWHREPPVAVVYAGVMFMAATASGACFVVAATARSHSGGIILVAS
jgi:hypothetical protein